MVTLPFCRRYFLTGSIQTMFGLGLAALMSERRLFAENGGLSEWFHSLNAACEALKSGATDPLEWQTQIDLLYGRVSIPLLLANIDYDRVRAGFDWNGAGEKFVDVKFAVPGLPDHLVMETKIAGIKKGRSIYPHGHRNMVSAFLTVEGEFHVRQFDRVDESETDMLIRGTVDKIAAKGHWSSISDQKDNVHWLTATTDDSFLFSTKISDINPSRPTRGRIPIDPRGEDLGSGIIKAKKISHAEAVQLFG